jgi:MYXO-CTERM domain-containing protein
MGSINMDHMGDIAIGYTVAGGVRPSVRYAGRLVTDPPGMMAQGETSLIEGSGLKTDNQNPSRWGDYSTMSVDPSDDCTFWYTQEYLVGSGMNWHTRIGSFRFPSCDAGSGTGGTGGSGGAGGAGGAGGVGGNPGGGGTGGTGDVGGGGQGGGSGGAGGQNGMGGVMTGCGCTVGAAPRDVPWLLALALALCLVRRRR